MNLDENVKTRDLLDIPVEMTSTRKRTVFVTGANGFIGNAVARGFARAGWHSYGLVRSPSSCHSLEREEVIPIVASIDNISTWEPQLASLPPIDVLISTTDDLKDYSGHYSNVNRLMRTLAEDSYHKTGQKALFIYTSGCKDYGMGPHIHGAPNLQPHTEASPLNPPNFAKERARCGVEALQMNDQWDPVVVRPTNVYGRSASYFRAFFEVASHAERTKSPLLLTAPPGNILHALHVDDCADAYVAIASHPIRDDVARQVFNISSERYETLGDIADALVQEYGLEKGPRYIDSAKGEILGEGEVDPWPAMLIDWPQWTGSEKLRRVTGWTDRRMQFGEGIGIYRMGYEAAVREGDERHNRIKSIVPLLNLTVD